MKKMKKVFAMLLALAMVLGMSMTAFADEATTGNITVTNIAQIAGQTATIKYVRIIEPDTTKATGWKFSKDDYAQAYISAYNASDDQDAITKLIASGVKNETDKTFLADGSAARQAISGASAKVPTTGAGSWQSVSESVVYPNPTGNGSVTWNVGAAPGIYIVKVQQGGYNYTAMAAYLGFGQISVNPNGGYTYPVMENATLSAKGSALVVNKTNDSNDNVVSVGDLLTYTIESTVPYVESVGTVVSTTYVIRDTITGATYDFSEAKVYYKDDANMTQIKDDKGQDIKPAVAKETDTTFTLDLTSVLNPQNSNADRTIVIKYQAKVTEIDNITNTAMAGHVNGETFDAEYGQKTDEVFTGGFQVTKTDDGETPKALPGAEFEVKKATYQAAIGTEEAKYVPTGEALKFVKVPAAGAEKEYYKFAPDATANYVTKIQTGGDGIARVKGLDIGYYNLEEVTAPVGYTINEKDVVAEVKKKDGVTDLKITAADQLTSVDPTMRDTQLTQLPSTGGIGTTIFTIAGCLIMVVAAGLFFASRRKSAAK